MMGAKVDLLVSMEPVQMRTSGGTLRMGVFGAAKKNANVGDIMTGVSEESALNGHAWRAPYSWTGSLGQVRITQARKPANP